MAKKRSGIEQVPRILKKPFWTDSFFWFGVAAAVFWIIVIGWVIG